MTFKEQLTTDLSVFFNTDEFAETITYTPSGGSPVSIPAIINRDAPLQEPYIRGENTAISEIMVKTSDVSNPQYGDTFTFDSETWGFDPENGVTGKGTNVLTIALIRSD